MVEHEAFRQTLLICGAQNPQLDHTPFKAFGYHISWQVTNRLSLTSRRCAAVFTWHPLVGFRSYLLRSRCAMQRAALFDPCFKSQHLGPNHPSHTLPKRARFHSPQTK